MSISEICNREVIYARADEPAMEAVQLMRSHHVGDVVVVDESSGQPLPVGILTDRDIVLEVVAEWVSIETVTVGDIMSREIWTINQQQDLFTAVALMRDKGVRRLPVVNDGGGLEGLLTVDDVLELTAELLGDISGLIGRGQEREMRMRR